MPLEREQFEKGGCQIGLQNQVSGSPGHCGHQADNRRRPRMVATLLQDLAQWLAMGPVVRDTICDRTS
jgi:hypothetical protein